MAMSKRSLLGGGLAIVAGYAGLRYGIPAIGAAVSGALKFEQMTNPVGFRHFTGGNSSVRLNPLVGLENDQDAALQETISKVRNNLCAALFGPEPRSQGVVPIASFSDYNCPYCRVLTAQLAKLEQESGGSVRLTWHELPLLGDLSVLAAKAALAAKRQGAYLAFHQRLMRASFLKTPEYIQRLAGDLEIDGTQLAVDMQGPEVLAEIRNSLALSRIFGLIGTPAIVVGNTVVQGQIEERALAKLIKRERADGPYRACE